MKQAFREQKITPEREAQISLVNEILEEYAAEGYKLTLRQIYYQHVARGVVENEAREYKKVMKTLEIGRYNGLIDWDMIEDRTRIPRLDYSVTSIQNALEDTVEYFKYNRQKGQPYHMEIWTEKDAVSGILARVASHYHIKLLIDRGYISHSTIYRSYKKILAETMVFAEANAGRVSRILYVGDHDPSGLDMLRDIEEKLKGFGLTNDDFRVIPVALRKSQVREYKIPENFAKITDPRARMYIVEHGRSSWEVDALKPKVLHKLVDDAVMIYLDTNQFSRMLRQEERDKKKLGEMVRKMVEEL